MTQYPKEFKESIIVKMLPPNNMTVSMLAKETSIPEDTIYTWRRKNINIHRDASPQPTSSWELSSEEKFTAVIESASLNETDLSEYCRRKGIFPAQLSAWKSSCIHANALESNKVDRLKLKTQAKQIKQLESELRRKDKALAETAALLVLQKKVHALWGDPEDEK